MKEALIQLCDIARFGYLIRKAPNNTLSSTQILNEVCFEKDRGIQKFFVKTCGVVAEKILPLAEGSYQCEIDTASTISSFEEKPCNPIRWDPNALVKNFCSTVGNNTGSFNTTTPTTGVPSWDSTTISYWDSTTIPTTEAHSWDSTTYLKLIGGTVLAVFTIGGMIYTGYQCFKKPKNTATDKEYDVEMRDMSNKQNDKVDQETTGLLDNPPSHTITEIINVNEITNVYEIINTKNETSPTRSSDTHIHNAAREVGNRVNSFLDKLNLDEREQLNELMNIVTASNDTTVPSNESNDVQSCNADQTMNYRLSDLLDDLRHTVTSPNDHITPSNAPVLLGDDMTTVNEIG